MVSERMRTRHSLGNEKCEYVFTVGRCPDGSGYDKSVVTSEAFMYEAALAGQQNPRAGKKKPLRKI